MSHIKIYTVFIISLSINITFYLLAHVNFWGWDAILERDITSTFIIFVIFVCYIVSFLPFFSFVIIAVDATLSSCHPFFAFSFSSFFPLFASHCLMQGLGKANVHGGLIFLLESYKLDIVLKTSLTIHFICLVSYVLSRRLRELRERQTLPHCLFFFLDSTPNAFYVNTTSCHRCNIFSASFILATRRRVSK